MKQTALLTQITERADALAREYGGDGTSAFHLAAAFAEFCATEYRGFAVSDNSISPNRYEEERLRFICERVVKMASYFRLRLKKVLAEETTLPAFDLTRCEQVAAARGDDTLSADLVFLCVLAEIAPACHAVYRTAVSDETILALLAAIDETIFDYTAKKVQSVIDKLTEKARTAAYKRDWRPAAKFAEPDEVMSRLCAAVEVRTGERQVTLRLRRFFGRCDLKLSIHRANGIYYVHDNGCAVRALSRRVTDTAACERMLRRVCHPDYRVRTRVTGCFTNTYGFFEYLRRLVFVAHADLFYTRAERRLREKERDYAYVGVASAEPMDAPALLALLREGIACCYDENRGLYLRVDTPCAVSTPRTFVRVETRADGTLCLTELDRGPYEGSLLEDFFFANDDIAPYGRYLSRWAQRFGVTLDGQELSLVTTADKLPEALGRFLGCATLFSVFGNGISLPTPRKRGGEHG